MGRRNSKCGGVIGGQLLFPNGDAILIDGFRFNIQIIVLHDLISTYEYSGQEQLSILKRSQLWLFGE